jgi:hypothetical protein
MDIDLAREFARSSFRISAELQELLPDIKRRCSEEEYRELARGIAKAIYSVGVALLNKALAAHPELEQEIEAAIANDGRYR